MSSSVIELGQEEARRRGASFVGTEHLLLALLNCEGLGVTILEEQGVTLEPARETAEKLAASPGASNKQDISLSPRSKRIADAAASLAREFGSAEVLTEHWLLAIVSEGDGLAMRILEHFGLKPAELRSEILKRLKGERGDADAQAEKPHSSNVDANGFALYKGIVASQQLSSLMDKIEPLRQLEAGAGMRNLLQRSESVRDFAYSDAVLQIAISGLKKAAHPVRAILFDKTPESNWYVTWHQDVTIAVKARADMPGFGPWSVKGGVHHVQAPAAVLEKMVALRIHFDDSEADNGPINFIPGSHKAGILNPEGIALWRAKSEAVSCPAQRGDIIIMRPLILHSSPIAKDPTHRRVLHIEYVGVSLPEPLKWAEA